MTPQNVLNAVEAGIDILDSSYPFVCQNSFHNYIHFLRQVGQLHSSNCVQICCFILIKYPYCPSDIGHVCVLRVCKSGGGGMYDLYLMGYNFYYP